MWYQGNHACGLSRHPSAPWLVASQVVRVGNGWCRNKLWTVKMSYVAFVTVQQISLAQFLERYLDVLQLHRHLDNDTYVTYVSTPYVPSFSGCGNILDAHHPTWGSMLRPLLPNLPVLVQSWTWTAHRQEAPLVKSHCELPQWSVCYSLPQCCWGLNPCHKSSEPTDASSPTCSTSEVR